MGKHEQVDKGAQKRTQKIHKKQDRKEEKKRGKIIPDNTRQKKGQAHQKNQLT